MLDKLGKLRPRRERGVTVSEIVGRSVDSVLSETLTRLGKMYEIVVRAKLQRQVTRETVRMLSEELRALSNLVKELEKKVR